MAAVNQDLLRFSCPQCLARLTVPAALAGRRTRCSHCQAAFKVPFPTGEAAVEDYPLSPEAQAVPRPAGETGEYALVEEAHHAAGEDYRLAGGAEATASETAPAADGLTPPPEPVYQRPVLPRRPLLSGTFSFPYSRGARLYAAGLALGAAVVLASVRECREDVLILCAIYLVVSVMLGVMWFALASACALAVVRDTANGCDEVQTWPGLAIFDWIADLVYPFTALCASMLPGAALGWLLARLGLPGDVVASLVVFFLFPIVLLSMLDNDSPLGTVSAPVWHTLRIAGRGWAGFYLATAALLAAAGAAFWAVGRAGAFLQTAGGGLILAAVWVIYFRLLGRLAWYCADRSALAEPEETTPETGEGPDDELAAGADDEEGENEGLLAEVD